MERTKYSDLLKDPRWQRKRLEIMQRDNFACVPCGDKKHTLNVHHKKYISGKKPWEYEKENLITVCENCHLLIEFLKKDDIDLLSMLKQNKIRCITDEIGNKCFCIKYKTQLLIVEIRNKEIYQSINLPLKSIKEFVK